MNPVTCQYESLFIDAVMHDHKVVLVVYETCIKMLELTTRKGDKTPLYLSVSMMSIVHETVCWTSGKSSLTRVWRHFQMATTVKHISVI